MIQIQNTLVSLDLIEQFFVCDLDACLGECCIEGDAGAPLAPGEGEALQELLPDIIDRLTPAAQEVARSQGVSYVDEEGDTVTSIVGGRDCIFTCYEKGGLCLCALEKARREGDSRFFKPISCSLYPVRLKEYGGFTAVNFHQWKICKPARILGRRKGVRAYQFLREPLIRRFGPEWYAELERTAEEWLRQHP